MNTKRSAPRNRLHRAVVIGTIALASGLAAATVSPASAATASPGDQATNVSVEATTAATTKRSVALDRAKSWLTASHGHGVPYGTYLFNGWRADCSGYVSMAWNVRDSRGNPVNHNTDSMVRGGYQTPGPIVHAITWNELKAGDAIGFLGKGSIGDAGHVMLFEKWADAAHTTYWVYEQHGPNGTPTDHRTHHKSYNGYKPYRYNNIVDG
jgi:hypothetical protein